MKRFVPVFISFAVAAGIITSVFLFPAETHALSLVEGVNAARGQGQPTELFGQMGVVSTITNVLLFIVGALSVIMLIIGGLRYAISGGNSSSVTAAKNTILYAIVGLVIAFLAYAIINWVLLAVAPGGSGMGAGYSDL
jgi:hypothetical protein